jgi:hypothetical protein
MPLEHDVSGSAIRFLLDHGISTRKVKRVLVFFISLL